eukprot:5227608-Pyramimonas_sp.AAC.1
MLYMGIYRRGSAHRLDALGVKGRAALRGGLVAEPHVPLLGHQQARLVHLLHLEHDRGGVGGSDEGGHLRPELEGLRARPPGEVNEQAVRVTVHHPRRPPEEGV